MKEPSLLPAIPFAGNTLIADLQARFAIQNHRSIGRPVVKDAVDALQRAKLAPPNRPTELLMLAPLGEAVLHNGEQVAVMQTSDGGAILFGRRGTEFKDAGYFATTFKGARAD